MKEVAPKLLINYYPTEPDKIAKTIKYSCLISILNICQTEIKYILSKVKTLQDIPHFHLTNTIKLKSYYHLIYIYAHVKCNILKIN